MRWAVHLVRFHSCLTCAVGWSGHIQGSSFMVSPFDFSCPLLGRFVFAVGRSYRVFGRELGILRLFVLRCRLRRMLSRWVLSFFDTHDFALFVDSFEDVPSGVADPFDDGEGWVCE